MNTTELALVVVQEGRLVAGREFSLALESLKGLCEGLVVADASSCQQARELVKKGRDDIKAIEAAAEPERLRIRKALDDLLAARNKMQQQFSAIIDPLDRKVRDWAIAEQEAAAKEEAKLNKGKRAEDRVEVKPNLTPVPGTRLVIRYKVEVINESKVKREWMTPNLPAIGKKAREDQDPELTMREVGGIRVTKD